jgi:hypothetical protein
MMMSAVDPDRFDRLEKLIVDSGHAPTFGAARELLRTYRLQILADASSCENPAWQAAILTAANAGGRAMHGGVQVQLGANPVCSVPIAAGRRLSDALTDLGATLVPAAEADVPTIVFGRAARVTSPALVYASAGRWTAQVGPEPTDAIAVDGQVPATVLTACVAVSELFQRLRGHPVAADRMIEVSIWRPGGPIAEREGPMLSALPAALWLLGLGHLGQAYAWLLGLLPYPADGGRSLVLQDDDKLTDANRATSMLHRTEALGMRKTRLAAGVMDPLGWNTRLIEARFAGGPLHRTGDPLVLLGGVDNPRARRHYDESGFPLIYDAGLGAGPDGFLDMTIRRLPASRPSMAIWPVDAPPARVAPAGRDAYAALEALTGDRCGIERLAGRTVATAFVGVAAACWVVGGLLRELHGGRALELVDFSLRNPSDGTVLEAPAARPPRVQTVSCTG